MTDANSAPPDRAPALAERDGRVVVIDILRGLAILWVMTFHLWTDMTYGVPGVSVLYDRLGDRLGEADPLAAFTAFWDLVLGSGYQGVAVFMLLSGSSLVLNSERRPDASWARAFLARCRRILPVYWAGVVLAFATVVAIALLQVAVDGNSFTYQLDHVFIARVGRVDPHISDLFWGLSVFGYPVREKLGTFTVASLWFVPVLLQYYLAYPLLLRLLRRVGPWNFAVAAVALNWFAQWMYFTVLVDYMAPVYDYKTQNMVGLFRCTEFMLGMSLGYLLAHRRDSVREWLSSPFDIGGVLVLGFLLQWASVSFTFDGQAADGSLVAFGNVGLALLIAPLLFKTPGRLETSVPARLLVGLGLVSITALIVNDNMRYVASFLREHDTPGAVWWLFLTAVYIPAATAVLAWPLARLFGLLPDQRRRAGAPAPPAEPAARPVELQPSPAAGGGG